MRKLLPLLLFTALGVSPGFGWWETGHEVVARIAASQLTPEAQTRVARILGVADTKEAVADALAAASLWADQVKGETKTGEWHYIDLTLQDQKGDEAKRCADQNCLRARITYFEGLLKQPANQSGSKWTELEQLKFLVHFVGDSTQPLHTITDADAGGNCENLEPPFQQAKNLHALWDGGIIGAMGENDRALASRLVGEIAQMTSRERRRLTKGAVMDWIWDSHKLAEKDVYRKLHVPKEPDVLMKGCAQAPAEIRDFVVHPDPVYVSAMKPVVDLQLMKGGLRLARVLNETL